jgi:molecular chaperone DnaK (HSP70)
VSAREQRSSKEAEIEVQPSYGLTDDQVENMLLESFDYAEEDFRQRQVIEARNESETILTALGKGRQSPAWRQLTGDEQRRIGKLVKALDEVKKGEDYQAIRKSIDELNQGTMRLAELMMDSAVSSALKGKRMDEADFGEGPDAPHPVGKPEFE